MAPTSSADPDPIELSAVSGIVAVVNRQTHNGHNLCSMCQLEGE